MCVSMYFLPLHAPGIFYCKGTEATSCLPYGSLVAEKIAETLAFCMVSLYYSSILYYPSTSGWSQNKAIILCLINQSFP